VLSLPLPALIVVKGRVTVAMAYELPPPPPVTVRDEMAPKRMDAGAKPAREMSLRTMAGRGALWP
jgi:hypothetical protein